MGRASVGVEDSQASLLTASGHSAGRRLRFAYCLTGPFVATGLFAQGKDLYLLEFGASAQSLGAILIVFSFLTPLVEIVAGKVQDQGLVFWRWFPTATWGRRAPWYLPHILGLAACVFAFFLPPSWDPAALNAWFALVWVVGYWCCSVCINAFEAGRVEIYKFKEERVLLEQYCKLVVVAAFGLGFGAVLAALTVSAAAVRAGCALVAALVVASGVGATPVLREARSAPTEQAEGMGTVLRGPLVRHMMLIRFLQGVYETVFPSVQLYYYAFVLRMGKAERLQWFSASGVLLGAVELLLAPVWSRLFAKSTTLMLYQPVCFRALDACLAPALLLSSRDPLVYIAYTGIWRACNCSFSYWRLAACGWVCDKEARGHEGCALGAFSMANGFGRALCTGGLMLGMGMAGFVATNCQGLSEAEEAACEAQKMDQPDAVADYVVSTLAVFAPALSLLICLLTLLFPLRPGSAQLAALYEEQRKRQELDTSASTRDTCGEDLEADRKPPCVTELEQSGTTEPTTDPGLHADEGLACGQQTLDLGALRPDCPEVGIDLVRV